MQVLGVSHVAGYHKPFGRTENYLLQTIRFFSRQALDGKTIAIEFDFPITELLEIDRGIQTKQPKYEGYRGGPAIHFWAELVRYLQKKRARVVTVEHYGLRVLHGRIRHSLRVHKNLGMKSELPYLENRNQTVNFRRTHHLVKKASESKADFLVTGYAHAREIQFVLGSRANVKLLVSKRHVKQYDTYNRKSFVDRFIADKKRKQRLSNLLFPVRKPRLARKSTN